MKLGGSGDVPGATCRGACQEATRVVSEEGDDRLQDLSQKLGDWGRSGWAYDGHSWGISDEEPLNLGFDLVPE